MALLLALLAGVVAGAALAIPAFRASRDPESALGRFRTALGFPPTPLLPAEREARELSRAFGPSRHSQFLEEWIIRDFFHDKRNGVFVDVGAADPRQASNTYFLEQHLGWSGIAVDAQDTYRSAWEQFRPK